jgi:hypothetical protein
VAKRRLVYNLLSLGLPLKNKVDDPVHGLAFEFLADSRVPGTAPVLTGHKSGVITISVVEADDAQREQRRSNSMSRTAPSLATSVTRSVTTIGTN